MKKTNYDSVTFWDWKNSWSLVPEFWHHYFMSHCFCTFLGIANQSIERGFKHWYNVEEGERKLWLWYLYNSLTSLPEEFPLCLSIYVSTVSLLSLFFVCIAELVQTGLNWFVLYELFGHCPEQPGRNRMYKS